MWLCLKCTVQLTRLETEGDTITSSPVTRYFCVWGFEKFPSDRQILSVADVCCMPETLLIEQLACDEVIYWDNPLPFLLFTLLLG